MKSEQSVELIGVINVESHKVKFSILCKSSGNVLLESFKSINLIKPYPGWVEVDAEKVWSALCTAIDEVIDRLKLKNLSKDDIKIIGITNERETVLVWDSESNKPLCNAIHFSDIRTDPMIQNDKFKDPNVFSYLENITGLKVTSMFSGVKLKWIIDNKNNIKQHISLKTIRFGTLDTWLVWKLTKGNLYVTDTTNASRTLLMDLKTCEWCPRACQVFNIPISLLPTIKSSSEQYGIIEIASLNGILIGSIFANHQAALYGLDYKQTGQIMSRYGDSCVVSCIIGTELIKSNNGLLTTVAYKIDKEQTVYALEGYTSIGGIAIEWLKNNMNIVDTDEDIKLLNIEASDVYFVPAFNGLAAPHWRPDARGIICGLSYYSDKKHIIRAALEALCFHTKDVIVAFEKDTCVAPSQLIVDGSYSVYDNLLSYQADIMGIDVKRSRMIDMAIYGSAKAAARAINIEFKNHHWSLCVLKPTTTEKEQKYRYSKWLKAVKRSYGLSRSNYKKQKLEKNSILSLNILSTAYLITMMGIMAASDKM